MDTALIEPLWSRLSGMSAEALRMTDDEAARFRANSVAKLVGLLPFIAGCASPERSALSHLATLVVANRGQARRVFDHVPSDDAQPLARLQAIADFNGGDAALVARGMALLGLCMLSGYRRDSARDALVAEYNPVLSGAWAGGLQERALRATIGAVDSPEMDAILSVDEALKGFWQA